MEPADALLLLVATGLAAAVVLRDIAAYDRPAAPPKERKPAKPAKTAKAAEAPRAARVDAPVRAGVQAPAQAPVQAPQLGVAAPVQAPALAGNVRVAERAFEPHAVRDGSMLGTLAADIEHDEHSAARRVVAALVLLTLTLLTAAGIGVLIYRGLSGFGS